MSNDQLIKLGFQTIRYLTQIAEALAYQGQYNGVTLSVARQIEHCSDRAEHVAQYFVDDLLASPASSSTNTRWIRRSLLDDVLWMMVVIETDFIKTMLDASAKAQPTMDRLIELANDLTPIEPTTKEAPHADHP